MYRILWILSHWSCIRGRDVQDSLRVITARGLLSSANKYPGVSCPQSILFSSNLSPHMETHRHSIVMCHLSPQMVPSFTVSPVVTTRPSAPRQASSQGASRTTVPRHPPPTSTPWVVTLEGSYFSPPLLLPSSSPLSLFSSLVCVGPWVLLSPGAWGGWS